MFTNITECLFHLMLTAMAQDKQMPSFFHRIHPIYHFSRRSLYFNILLALSLLWFFPSWESLVIIVSLFHIISYMACPIALMRLRIIERDRPRKFRLAFANIICPFLFVFVTFLFCLSPEHDLLLVTSVLVIFYGIYIFISNQGQWQAMFQAVKRSYDLILYFIVLSGLGLIGNPNAGGLGIISSTTFYALMILCSLSFYYSMVYRRLPSHVSKSTEVIVQS